MAKKSNIGKAAKEAKEGTGSMSIPVSRILEDPGLNLTARRYVGTTTGRFSSKSPNLSGIPRTKSLHISKLFDMIVEGSKPYREAMDYGPNFIHDIAHECVTRYSRTGDEKIMDFLREWPEQQKQLLIMDFQPGEPTMVMAAQSASFRLLKTDDRKTNRANAKWLMKQAVRLLEDNYNPAKVFITPGEGGIDGLKYYEIEVETRAIRSKFDEMGKLKKKKPKRK